MVQAALKSKPKTKLEAAPKAPLPTDGKKTKAVRQIKQPNYKSFKLSHRLRHPGPKLTSAWALFVQSLRQLWHHKLVLGGILLIYGLLQLTLVQGILGSDFTQTSDSVRALLGGEWAGLASAVTLLSYLVGTTGQATTAEAGVYQGILLLFVVLAFVWALRQLLADKTVRVRDSFYQGMYPIVPFILVLGVIVLQLVPLLIGSWLYQTVVSVGIAVSITEQLIWLAIFGILGVLSFYLVLSSLFALFIVTLPGMTPIRALRSARKLVLHRRLVVIVKLLFLSLCVLILGVVVLLPIIMWLPALAPWVFYALTIIVVGLVITYLYGLYRELLRE